MVLDHTVAERDGRRSRGSGGAVLREVRRFHGPPRAGTYLDPTSVTPVRLSWRPNPSFGGRVARHGDRHEGRAGANIVWWGPWPASSPMSSPTTRRAARRQRLAEGLASLELVRTRAILQRHLPPPPADVLDVGGGTGVHADWLLADGYRVHLVDLAPRHVEEAVARSGPARRDGRGRRCPPAGDARRLLRRRPRARDPCTTCRSKPTACRCCVKRAAWFARVGSSPPPRSAGSHRCSTASLREHLFEPEFREIVRRDLRDGRHDNPTGRAALVHHRLLPPTRATRRRGRARRAGTARDRGRRGTGRVAPAPRDTLGRRGRPGGDPVGR